ncbi:hypothetical protein [Candidatus Poriferisodalis sp.]|uniref:hypothetical protein n=1 Tax=Candidatus Poriferisodalis sp. TaxID=3101277 RepID=UPI003B58EE1B
MAAVMWHSIRYYWERYLFWATLAVVAFGVLRWDWHTVVWEWLGQTNGDETNSSTFRNFGLIFLPVVAIYLTWKRIKIAAREARTSRDNLRTARSAAAPQNASSLRRTLTTCPTCGKRIS